MIKENKSRKVGANEDLSRVTKRLLPHGFTTVLNAYYCIKM